MKKLTLSLIGLVFLLFAFSANAAGLGEDCNIDADCIDSVYCNGIESCSSEGSVCVAGEPVVCDVGECSEDIQGCTECSTAGDCDDGVYCNGEEICDAGACLDGEPVDCGDQFCDEITEGCVDCQSAGDCDDGVYCNGEEICDAGACLDGEPVVCTEGFCNEDIQGCAECEDDLDCVDNATPFCSDTLECVECLEDLDCTEGEICELGACVEQSICSLFIRPPVLNLKKGVKPVKQMFTIKGIEGEGFDPDAEIDFGPCEVVESFVAGGSGVLKVRVEVPDNATFEGDFLDVQVGECTGQVYIKNPGNKHELKELRKQEKMALKEQRKLEQQEKKAAKNAAKEAKKAAKNK